MKGLGLPHESMTRQGYPLLVSVAANQQPMAWIESAELLSRIDQLCKCRLVQLPLAATRVGGTIVMPGGDGDFVVQINTGCQALRFMLEGP